MARPFTTDTPLGAAIFDAGFTLTEFAARCGVHADTVGRYVNNRIEIPQGHLLLMAQTLGVPTDLLVTDEPLRPPSRGGGGKGTVPLAEEMRSAVAEAVAAAEAATAAAMRAAELAERMGVGVAG